MPTGYTADLKIDTPFRDFAMGCARAMGACVLMRDDPQDARIPDEFKPSTFYKEHMEKSQAELKRLDNLGSDAWLLEYEVYCRGEEKERQRMQAKDAEQAEIYNRMIERAQQWEPPTTEHEGLKNFMLEQLRTSLQHDVFGEEFIGQYHNEKPYKEWREMVLSRAEHSVLNDSKHWREEQERTAGRNAWIRELRFSLTK